MAGDFWEQRGKLPGILSVEPCAVEADRAGEERFRRQLLRWTAGLMTRARLLPAAHLVDLGCGFGDVSAHLAPDCRRITAVDGSTSMVEQTRRTLAATGHTDWRAVHGDLVAYDEVPADADLIYLGAVGMYLTDDQYAALVTRIAARAGSRVVIVQRDYVAMNGGWTGVSERGDYKSYRRTAARYLELAAGAGFACELLRYSSDMTIELALAKLTFDRAPGRVLAAALRPVGRLVRAGKKAGSATFILRRGSVTTSRHSS